MTTKVLDVPTLFLVQNSPGQSVDLVIGRGNGSCEKIRLRDNQLKHLAMDAPRMALNGSTTLKLDE